MADDDKLLKDEDDFVAWGLGWAFWIQWVLANTIGWNLGPMTQQALIEASGTTRSQVALGIGLGVMLGLAQWLIFLPQPYHVGLWWVLAGVAGWGIGWPLGWSLGWGLFEGLGLAAVYGMIGLVGGLLVGVTQWLILRGQIHRAGWWVLVSALGWGVALTLVFGLTPTLLWTITGGVAAALTGGPLIWLLRQPIDESLRTWIEPDKR